MAGEGIDFEASANLQKVMVPVEIGLTAQTSLSLPDVWLSMVRRIAATEPYG